NGWLGRLGSAELCGRRCAWLDGCGCRGKRHRRTAFMLTSFGFLPLALTCLGVLSLPFTRFGFLSLPLTCRECCGRGDALPLACCRGVGFVPLALACFGLQALAFGRRRRFDALALACFGL